MGPTEIPSQSTETIKIPTANYEFGATFIDHPKLMLLGRILTDGRLSARVKCDVSENLTLKANAQEVFRIRAEHPNDNQAILNDRVKGQLKVTRAFGAGFLKRAALKAGKQTQDGRDEEITALRVEIQVRFFFRAMHLLDSLFEIWGKKDGPHVSNFISFVNPKAPRYLRLAQGKSWDDLILVEHSEEVLLANVKVAIIGGGLMGSGIQTAKECPKSGWVSIEINIDTVRNLFAYTLICTGVFMCVVTCLGHMAAVYGEHDHDFPVRPMREFSVQFFLKVIVGEIKHSQAAHVTNLWRDFFSELIVEKIKCF
ncbi:Mitochondrial import receptor subunit [Arachis hypogaea]|nr:Mitochondrial import receptor subunit [Arachis hypogaea]